MNIVAIDGGTTNTRLTLISNEKIVCREKLHVGAGNGKSALECAVSDTLNVLSKKASIDLVVASGMIGSELGLLNVPHTHAPISAEELAKSAVSTELFGFKFLFVPGVKCNADDPNGADMMRGEETEFFGIAKIKSLSGNVLAVLPGSHTKLILSENSKIRECVTTIGGEMLAALSKNTILKNSLPDSLSATPDLEYVVRGYEYARENGIGSALFKVRILKNLFGATDDQLCGFFCGAVLSDDVELIAKHSDGRTIVVGGSDPLRSLFTLLIEKETGISPVKLDCETSELATVIGALEIAKLNGDIK